MTSEYLRDNRGSVQQCMHARCMRPAVRVIAWDSPKHKQFKGATHNCCAVHSRAVSDAPVDEEKP